MDEQAKHEALTEERRDGFHRMAEEVAELVEALEGSGFQREEAIALSMDYIVVRYQQGTNRRMLEILIERLGAEPEAT